MEKKQKDEISKKILEGVSISEICNEYKVSMIALLIEMRNRNDVFAKIYSEYKSKHS